MTIRDVYGCDPSELVCPEGFRFTDTFRGGYEGEWLLGNNINNNTGSVNKACQMPNCQDYSKIDPRLILEKLDAHNNNNT